MQIIANVMPARLYIDRSNCWYTSFIFLNTNFEKGKPVAESLRCLEDDSSQFTYEEAQNVSDTTDAFKKHTTTTNGYHTRY